MYAIVLLKYVLCVKNKNFREKGKWMECGAVTLKTKHIFKAKT